MQVKFQLSKNTVVTLGPDERYSVRNATGDIKLTADGTYEGSWEGRSL